MFAGPGNKPADLDFLIPQYLRALNSVLGLLLGANVSATEKQSQTVNKNEIADTIGGVGQVAAVYSVTGSITSQAYLIVEERDAIRFGMLLTDAPEKISGATSADHHFNSDCQDSRSGPHS